MTSIEVFAKISQRQVTALMFHEQMADYFDFLNLHGFKRMHEYQYLKESIDMRKVHRYAINHYNQLLQELPSTNPNAIPTSWIGVSRFDVQNKKELCNTSFSKWRDWESETKAFYSDMYITLQQQKDVAGACFVANLIKDVDCELKKLDRKMITVADSSLDVIIEMQDELHEEYKSKTKDLKI